MPGLVVEVKALDQRLSSVESDLQLIADEDMEANCKEQVRLMASTLRGEFQKYVTSYFDARARKEPLKTFWKAVNRRFRG